MNPTKPVILSLLFCLLVWFIWSFNLKPLQINKEINMADNYVKTGQCSKAIEKMEKDVLPSQSIIGSYAKLKYIDIIGKCNSFSQKTISVLEQAGEIRPYYTRTWIFLGTYTNVLIKNSSYFKVKNVEELKKQAYSYFEKAQQLSPKREQLFISWLQTDLIFEQYQKVKEKAEKCIGLNPDSGYCWWIRGLSNLYLDKAEQGIKDIRTAEEKKFGIHSKEHVFQFTTACEKTKNTNCFGGLTDIYYPIAVLGHSSELEYRLRLIYLSAIGEKEEILKDQINFILKNWPESESELKNTLKSANEYTNKINLKAAEQYIENAKKIIKLTISIINNITTKSNIRYLEGLPESELSKIPEYSTYQYLSKINNEEIKLIKND